MECQKSGGVEYKVKGEPSRYGEEQFRLQVDMAPSYNMVEY